MRIFRFSHYFYIVSCLGSMTDRMADSVRICGRITGCRSAGRVIKIERHAGAAIVVQQLGDLRIAVGPVGHQIGDMLLAKASLTGAATARASSLTRQVMHQAAVASTNTGLPAARKRPASRR